MNSSSYTMCEQSLIPTPQMPNFLRDKQAWENAIAHYQGVDPLDHWYNYVCWYENYSHGDPENKYRETLERCLGIFEHNDCYKQDIRMLRLWFKYIDMQANPLTYYQELYHRNIGRKLAAFYMKWGAYYETFHAWKEAEAVYNLGFQEEALPISELQRALNKVVYARIGYQDQLLAQQQEQHQVKLAQEPHQQQQQQQQVTYEQMKIQRQQQQHHEHQISQQQQQQQQIHHQQQQQLEAATSSTYHKAQQQHQQTVALDSKYEQYHAQQQHHQQQQQEQQQQLAQTTATTNYHTLYSSEVGAISSGETEIRATIENTNLNSSELQGQGQAYSTSYNNEIADSEQDNEQQYYYQEEEAEEEEIINANEPITIIPYEEIEIPSFKYPPNFVNYSSVPQIAKPLRCLAEPWSPNRKNYYAKESVYPENEECEYSPEELVVMKKYSHLSANHVDDNNAELQYVEVPTSAIDERLQNGQSKTEDNMTIISENSSSSSTSSNKEDNYGFSEREDDEAAPESTEDADDNDDSEPDYETANDLETQNHVPQIYAKEDVPTMKINNNNNNMPIKIKLKKERSSNDANGSYKITNIYQHEISSPKSSTSGRNGHHNFHPYLDNASTPKTNSVSRRQGKGKLKMYNNEDEFPQGYCINSNSSTNEPSKSNAASSTITAASDNAVQNAHFNDNANYSFSSAVNFDNSNCSISAAVDRLNFRDNSALSGTFHNTSTLHAMKNTTGNVDISTYQENSYFATQYDAEAKEIRLEKALATIKHHLSKEIIDPFNSELCRAFLTKIDFPGREFEAHDNYKITQTPFPKVANTKVLNLGVGVVFNIDKEVGRGAYGSVYKATSASTGAVVALKCTKPANTWEIYICDQVLKRIKQPEVLPGFMDISTAIISPNASLIATEFSPFGSLLDINNKLRQATTKVMHESLVMHFSAEICSIVHHLHKQKIIHADIKPDNFLLMRVPSTEIPYPSVRLIDFGCAIDMTMFPNDDTKFRKVIQTDGFTCIEMLEGRPWSYETDLFCVAGTIHVMLFGDYMHAQKRALTWDIKQKLPRYFKKHVWTRFFGELLNIDSTNMPNLDDMRKIFRREAALMDSELQKQIRTLSNILYKR